MNQSNVIISVSLLPAACYISLDLCHWDRNAVLALSTIGTMFMAGAYCGILTTNNQDSTRLKVINNQPLFTLIPGFVVPVFNYQQEVGPRPVIKLESIVELYFN